MINNLILAISIILFTGTTETALIDSTSLNIMIVGPRWQSPEQVLESFWQTMNEQDLEKLALHFSYVTRLDAPEIAAEMWPCNIKNYGIEIFEKTVLNDTLIHFKYFVKLERGRFKSGDLMVYNPYFGWRILAPCSDPPVLDDLK